MFSRVRENSAHQHFKQGQWTSPGHSGWVQRSQQQCILWIYFAPSPPMSPAHQRSSQWGWKIRLVKQNCMGRILPVTPGRSGSSWACPQPPKCTDHKDKSDWTPWLLANNEWEWITPLSMMSKGLTPNRRRGAKEWGWMWGWHLHIRRISSWRAISGKDLF